MVEQEPQPARRRDVPEASWSQVWQLPALLLGLGLLVLGIWLIWPEHEAYDHPAALDRVERLLAAENLEGAQAQLEEIREHLGEEPASAVEGRMRQYWGDLAYRQVRRQYDRPVDTPGWRENHRRVIEHYRAAEELGRELDGGSMRRWAQALVALGREQEALDLLERLAEAAPRDRYRVIRSLIEREREQGPGRDWERLVPLMERFRAELRREPDEARRREQEIWLAKTRAEFQIEAGDPGRAIRDLLVRIQRLGNEDDLAPLRAMLGKAYQATGGLEDAERYYQLAQQQVGSTDPLNAEILVGLGEITLAEAAGETGRGEEQAAERALEHFGQVVQMYPSEPAYLEALLGKADSEARLGHYGESVESFRLAVEELLERTAEWDPRRERARGLVRSQVDRLVDEGRYERALDFLSLLRPMEGPELPTELLLDFAILHEHFAQQRQEDAERAEAEEGPALSEQARRLANQEAATHYARSAEYYLDHAREVTITQDEAHGQSLWQAARNFDRAQRWRDAIDVYGEFIETREDDPLHVRATKRLGMAQLADGQYEAAVDRLRGLVEDRPRSPEAYQSLVPMAMGLIAMERFGEAERVLQGVVEDHEAITPETTEYREALVELGKLYYRMGEENGDYYVDAIERLEEAVARYGHREGSPQLRFLLADAYRRSVQALERELEQRQTQRDRVELQAERRDRLEEAQKYYNQVINELESLETSALSELQELYLRNAYFYQADCAYDREQYEVAIDLYHDAATRWKEDPASLMALVQIFNAHCELGQFQEAEVANERARAQLERIPDEAFDDPSLPMSRQHWEDWLRWTSEVNLREPQVAR